MLLWKSVVWLILEPMEQMLLYRQRKILLLVGLLRDVHYQSMGRRW